MKSTVAEYQSCSVPVRVFRIFKSPYRLRPHPAVYSAGTGGSNGGGKVTGT